MHFMNVDLPAPEPPTKATNSPGLILILTCEEICFVLNFTRTRLTMSIASKLMPLSNIW